MLVSALPNHISQWKSHAWQMSAETREKGVRSNADAVRKSSTLQSVNHNRLRFTNAMQLYFYWLFLLQIFGRALLTHVSFRRCVRIPFRSISGDNRFGWHFLFFSSCGGHTKQKKELIAPSSHIGTHTHEGTAIHMLAIFLQFSLYVVSATLANWKFEPIVFSDRELLFLFVWQKRSVWNRRYSCMGDVFVCKHFLIFDDSFHFIFQFPERAGSESRR